MNLKYRADIDGLRAIAVLSVVLDHAGIPLFHGGYIGVDIFFVISGYLITGIIIREINPLLHTWSLAVEEQFYIVFPLLMFLLARYFKPRIRSILIFIALASFVWSIFALQSDPSSAFYFAHLRAWELLMGGLLGLDLISTNMRPVANN